MTRVSGPGESAGPSLNVPPAQFDQPRPVPDRPGPGRQPRPLTLQDSSSHGGHCDCLYRPRKLSVSVADHIFKFTLNQTRKHLHRRVGPAACSAVTSHSPVSSNIAFLSILNSFKERTWID